MPTKRHTFIDLFCKGVECQDEVVRLKNIVIPIIQRDYAQGRCSPEATRVRKRFLDALYDAVTKAPITLDFVYGDADDGGVMTPLDGQQRLTTLFLLHWYAAKRAVLPPEEFVFLHGFTYETRYSARDFCTRLVDFTPAFDGKLSAEIIDQPWFPLSWQQDQTVASMLVMLDNINDKFADAPDLWQRLQDGAIGFYVQLLSDMGMTDDVYIKMNSRGKPLTDFEHFKAELEHTIREIDPTAAERIMHKVDVDWTDMLWLYRGDDNIIDDEFLRYFHFICDVICYHAGESTQGKSGDEFDLLERYFSPDTAGVQENIQTLEAMFDCWCDFRGETQTEFLFRVFAHEHTPGKVQIGSRYAIDIFEDCLRNNSEIVGGRNRKFPLNRLVLLYAITTYLQNKSSISEADFIRRLRVINNLTLNSEDEISDSTSRNRMPAILQQTDSVMLTGTFDDSIDNSFNALQIAEEKEKLAWCLDHPDSAELLFEAEDHKLLYGQIGIIGLADAGLFRRFQSLFTCNEDCINRALMACGPYLQAERNGWRYQLGVTNYDPAWTALFHRGANTRYAETQATLATLLGKYEQFTDQRLEDISAAYLADCESRHTYDWRYYYIKYKEFRPDKYGKYVWYDFAKKPYEFYALGAQMMWSSTAVQPFLQAVMPDLINRVENGKSLLYKEKYAVFCLNSCFVVKETTDSGPGKVCGKIDIEQNEDGIDTEDRILKARAQLPALLNGLD